MKYFFKEHQINFGDPITFNSIKTTFTLKLLNDNPNLFDVIEPNDNIRLNHVSSKWYLLDDCNEILLFTTHDEVNIFNENTIVYGVLIKKYSIDYQKIKLKTIYPSKHISFKNIDCLWFSTSEARDKWIYDYIN